MASWKDRKSPLMALFRCHRANKILIPLIVLCLCIIALSSHFNSRAADAFSELKSFSPQKKPERNVLSLFNYAAMIVFIHYFFAMLSEFIGQFCSLIVFKAFLTESVNKHLQMDYVDFHAKGTGRVQEDISRSGKAARGVMCMLSFELPRAVIEFGFSVKKLYTMMNPQVFVMFFALFSTTIIFSVLFALYTYRNERINITTYRKSVIPLTDIINNFDLIKAYNKESDELELYGKALNPFITRAQMHFAIWCALSFLQKVVFYLPHFYIFYLESRDIYVWREPNMDITRRLFTLVVYNDSFGTMKKSVMGFRDKVFALTRETAELDEDLRFAVNEGANESNRVVKKTFDNEIRLDNVDLYAGNTQIQHGQSFTIKKGEKVAITGANGAGKSVFTKTLLKFFKNEGKLYIDDTLIENISTKALRSLFAYVPQDPHIFNNTVLYNLGYAQKGIDPQKIYSECEKFGLHDFFKKMRDGYHTEAGERGKYLSGGQKQRVAFMRAIIKDTPILVMDEPTANIDRQSEHDLIDKIMTNCNEKTFLIIVHNLDLMKRFDRILYFTKDGVKAYNSYQEFEDAHRAE